MYFIHFGFIKIWQMSSRSLIAAALLLVGSGQAAIWQYAPRPAARLDLELPAGSGPFPLFIAVHGGGWESGTRADALPFCRIVVSAGFACAAPDYRLAPAARLPAQLEDLRDALMFLRQNASRLHLQPDRIILAGESARGHPPALPPIPSNR